jgi:hypothetical protein
VGSGGYVGHHNRKETKMWSDVMKAMRGWNLKGRQRETRGTAVCCVWWSARYGTDCRETRRAETSDCGVDAISQHATSFRRGLMLRQITNCSSRGFRKGLDCSGLWISAKGL